MPSIAWVGALLHSAARMSLLLVHTLRETPTANIDIAIHLTLEEGTSGRSRRMTRCAWWW